MSSEGEVQRLTGMVKWFNNKAGFGFVTCLRGDREGEDVFVHHSGVKVGSEQYKYLVQGEYVNFLVKTVFLMNQRLKIWLQIQI